MWVMVLTWISVNQVVPDKVTLAIIYDFADFSPLISIKSWGEGHPSQ